jgi:hypothetical protein
MASLLCGAVTSGSPRFGKGNHRQQEWVSISVRARPHGRQDVESNALGVDSIRSTWLSRLSATVASRLPATNPDGPALHGECKRIEAVLVGVAPDDAWLDVAFTDQLLDELTE